MPLRVIGIMSGTSFDAVDAAAVELDFAGDVITLRPLGLVSRPYPEAVREALADALPPRRVGTELICRLDTEIGQSFAEVAERAIDELCDGRADLVASHGQTVFHWVENGAARGTLQLGQPAWIAERTGLPVVADFRARDIAAGGQGAPLVGLLDVLWLRSRPGNPVALNLGGIANITVGLGASPMGKGDDPLEPPLRSAQGQAPAFPMGKGDDPLDPPLRSAQGQGPAFPMGKGDDPLEPPLRSAQGQRPAFPMAYDTGPANALLDAAVRAVTGEPYDRDGARAARGRVLPEALDRLLAEPYYRRRPPKSTGKELFHLGHLDGILRLDQDSLDDALATLTELTARTVAEAILRHDPTEVVAAGGGLRNPTLVRRLAALLDPVPLRSADELGLPSAAKEAILFALLGFLTVHGLPGTLPSATGARHPSVLGSITPGRGPLALLPEPVPPRAVQLLPPP